MDRQVEAGSDEMLTVGTALSFGLATGLLLAGASRVLVLSAFVPAAVLGLRLLDRSSRSRTERVARSALPATGARGCKAADIGRAVAGDRLERPRPYRGITVARLSDTKPEGRNMDPKNTYREGEQTTKEAWRQADGDESVADTLGNAGDELRRQAGNLGDDLDHGLDDAGDAAKRAQRGADGEDLADKIGNAGDDLRREVSGRP